MRASEECSYGRDAHAFACARRHHEHDRADTQVLRCRFASRKPNLVAAPSLGRRAVGARRDDGPVTPLILAMACALLVDSDVIDFSANKAVAVLAQRPRARDPTPSSCSSVLCLCRVYHDRPSACAVGAAAGQIGSGTTLGHATGVGSRDCRSRTPVVDERERQGIMAGGDEVVPVEGGEQGLSKNEQKRRAKQAEKERLAAEKAAAKKEKEAAAPKKEKKDDGAAAYEEDDEDIPPEKYFENRSAWVDKKKQAGTSPYPHKFQTTMQLPEYHTKYSSVEPGGFADAVEGVAGTRTTRLVAQPLQQTVPRSKKANATSVLVRTRACPTADRPRNVQALGWQGPSFLRHLLGWREAPGLYRRTELHGLPG